MRSHFSLFGLLYVGLDGDTLHGPELEAVGLADPETGSKKDGSSSTWITNLLQDVSPMEGTSSSDTTGGGIYARDCLPPVPARIAAKVCRWEFRSSSQSSGYRKKRIPMQRQPAEQRLREESKISMFGPFISSQHEDAPDDDGTEGVGVAACSSHSFCPLPKRIATENDAIRAAVNSLPTVAKSLQYYVNDHTGIPEAA